MRVRNVLVFPAGTECGLEIFSALKYCKEVQLFGAGQHVSNHAQVLYAPYHVLPSVDDANWLKELSDLCVELHIDYIFPAHDDVLVALSKNRAAIAAVVICPEQHVCVTTRSKSATYEALSKVVRVPSLFQKEQLPTYQWPVLIKPDKGQGSQGVAIVHNHQELAAAIRNLAEPLVCEYLPGEEYTVDCFSDRDRGLMFAKARSRRRVRNGISVNTVSQHLSEAFDIAEKITSVFALRGAWFFQLKRTQGGELCLLEVAPRIAGAMATHRVMGVNFPLLSIYEHERVPIRILLNQGSVELDRALSNRYRHDIDFDSLYVDLDDTLLLNGVVNSILIALIFEVIAKGKPVVLLTRHAGDLFTTLTSYRLSSIFDRVVHLSDQERKSDYIQGARPILIDDSFSERIEVSEKLGIPTFDCSMIEMLLENRR